MDATNFVVIRQQVKKFLTKENPANIWIAYSGGVDSHVLLHALNQYKDQCNIHAIHVNHNLLPRAADWTKHCLQTCKQLNIPCETVNIDVDLKNGESVEAAARYARYDAFKRRLKQNAYLLTAHHQDDQAETFLLQLLRGAGVKGLAAIPAKKTFAKGYLCRPFLSVTRETILAYAKENKLNWIEDESNKDVRFVRNFIRQQVMPLLITRWPQAGKTIARSCKHIGEANFLLNKLALEDLAKLEQGNSTTLSIEKLLNLSAERQHNLLRYWICQNHIMLPDEKKLQAIIDEVVLAREDANPCVNWGDVEIRRFQDGLYLLKGIKTHDATTVFDWDVKVPLELPADIGTLIAKQGKGIGIKKTNKKITVRFRQGGETCQLPDRGCHTLKNLFQEWRIPPWQRDQVPLIFVGDELAMVCGYALCEPFLPKENEDGLEIALLAN